MWTLTAQILGKTYLFETDTLTPAEVRAFVDGDLEVLEKLDPRMVSVDAFEGKLVGAPPLTFETSLDWIEDAMKFAEPVDDNGEMVQRIPLGVLFGVPDSTPCPVCDGEGCEYCGNLGSRAAYERNTMEECINEFTSRTGIKITTTNRVDYHAERAYVSMEE